MKFFNIQIFTACALLSKTFLIRSLSSAAVAACFEMLVTMMTIIRIMIQMNKIIMMAIFRIMMIMIIRIMTRIHMNNADDFDYHLIQLLSGHQHLVLAHLQVALQVLDSPVSQIPCDR